MSLSKLRGNENIADVITLEPYADIDQIRETLINVIRWLGDREPVAPGDVFLKFATWGGLVDRKVLTEKDILTNDDNPGDGDPPDEPEELYVEFMARDMVPSVTDGSSSVQVSETGPTYPNLHYIEFDPDTDTSCEISTILPAGWIGGTFQFRLYWSHGFGSVSAWDTKWELQVNTYSSGQDLARVLVPGSIVQTTGGATDTLYITAESDPVNIPGELNLPGNYVVIRIFRRGTDAADTLTVPARLHAVRFNLGNAPVDYPPTGDPDWAYVSLLIQDGTDAATLIEDRSDFASTVTATSNAQWSTAHPSDGNNTLAITSIGPGIPAFTSSGTGSRFSRAAGEDMTVECYVYFSTLANFSTSLPIFWWTHDVGGDLVRMYLQGSAATLVMRQLSAAEVTYGALSYNALHHIQLTIEGDTYYLDVDGVQVGTGSFLSYDSAGTYNVHVCAANFADSSGGTTQAWVTPFRWTKVSLGLAATPRLRVRSLLAHDVSAVAFPNG